MEHAKLDAALASALADLSVLPAGEQPAVAVLVHVDASASPAEQASIAALGVGQPLPGTIATATVGARAIEALSEQPAVRRITLSKPLDLFGPRC